MKPKLTPHQRIIRASERGTGIRLTEEEVWILSCDDAVASRAEWDDAAGGDTKRLEQGRLVRGQPE